MVKTDEVKKMELSKKLKKLRIDHHLSQEILATKLGVSRQAVSKWESGMTYPDFDNLVQLSNLYGVSLDYIMKGGQIENGEKVL